MILPQYKKLHFFEMQLLFFIDQWGYQVISNQKIYFGGDNIRVNTNIGSIGSRKQSPHHPLQIKKE